MPGVQCANSFCLLRSIFVGGAFWLALPASFPAHAQPRSPLTDPPAVAATIRLVPVATLRTAASATHSLDRRSVVVRTRHGYVAAPLHEPGSIAVFDHTGAFLRVVGSRGSGPREFAHISSLSAVHGDTILVVDRGNGRVAVLDPDFTIARTFLLRGPAYDMVQGESDALIARIRAAGVPQPLHFIGSDGRIIQSFGPRANDAAGALHDRELVLIPEKDLIVAIGKLRYEIEVYDKNGNPRYTLYRAAPWARSEGLIILDAQRDREGRLLVLSLVPQPVAPAGQGIGMPDEVRPLTPEEVLRENVVLLDVIDLERRTIVASARTRELYLRGFAGVGEIYSRSEDEVGLSTFRIWQIEVVPPSTAR
jgi:hypothetical protein